MATSPPAEIAVDAALVRALLEAQHPDLAARPLRHAGAGWDNELYRLGGDLVVRLPRRAAAVPLARHEQRWLPELAAGLPLGVPVPVRLGVPGAGYPWPWSVTRWFPGRSALAAPPRDLRRLAADLGRFLAALHRPAPADAPVNPFRGVALTRRRDDVVARVATIGAAAETAAGVTAAELMARWDELAATEAWSGPPCWLHGDVHPGNLVVDDGRLRAVVDFGDVTAGDPAGDLAVAWMLLPPALRPVLREAAGTGPAGAVDDATWRRAQGWALTFAVSLLATSDDAPAYAALARRTLRATLG